VQFAPAIATHSDQRGYGRTLVGVAAPKVYEEFVNDRGAQVNQVRNRLTGQESIADILTGEFERFALTAGAIVRKRLAQYDEGFVVRELGRRDHCRSEAARVRTS